MVKTLELTNNEIYGYAINIMQDFANEDINLPIKVNFYLQKNIKKIIDMGQEIENERMNICKKYGTLSEDGSNYNFEGENATKASDEITELLKLTQEVKINTINLEDFGDITLTSKQLNAIEFMINDEEE